MYGSMEEVNPAGVDIWVPLGWTLDQADVNGAGPAYQVGLSATVDDEPCRDKFPDGCPFSGPFCHAPTGECKWPKCIKRFSADEWKGCTHNYDEKFDCGCTNDDGINTCCGSANQTEAIEIWSECLAGE